MRGSLAVVVVLAATAARAQPSMTPIAQPPSMAPGYVAPPEPVGKVGYLHGGLSVDLLDVGAMQAFTSHGHASGVTLGVMGQIDLGARWALRMPIEISAGGFGDGRGYGELVVVPGAVYRFRSVRDQAWSPYVGGGLRFGFVGIGKRLTGEPLTLACCHDWGGHGGFGGSSGHADPYVHNTGTWAGDPSVEAWGGIEWAPARWMSFQLAGALVYEHIAGVTVIVLRETLGLRVSL